MPGGNSIALADGGIATTPKAKCPPKPKHRRHKVHCPPPCPVVCEVPEPCAVKCPPCPTGLYQTGPYAGALIGYSHMWAKSKSTLLLPARPSLLPIAIASSKKHSDSFLGELELGWRYVFPLGFTTGIEVAADFTDDHVSPSLQTALFNFRHKFKRNFSVTPALTIGHVFCYNWHAFVKLGVGVSWIKTHLTNVTTGTTFKKTKTKAGFAPSVGLEYAFNCNLSAVGTVGYEIYERVQSFYPLPIPNANLNANVRVVPKFFNTKIGVLYRF